ncbi:MAG: hypothetical protein ACOCU7_01205, partial [Tangfeifania sp.]
GNSIIYGNNAKEIELGNNMENVFNYEFDHCIIQVPDTFNISNNDNFKSVWRGEDYNPEFVDPYEEYDYSLDTLSAAKDIGKKEFAEKYPLDIMNKDRTGDDGPDLGAFERIEKKKDEK